MDPEHHVHHVELGISQASFFFFLFCEIPCHNVEWTPKRSELEQIILMNLGVHEVVAKVVLYSNNPRTNSSKNKKNLHAYKTIQPRCKWIYSLTKNCWEVAEMKLLQQHANSPKGCVTRWISIVNTCGTEYHAHNHATAERRGRNDKATYLSFLT